jgi:hypothetical protein
MATWEIKSDDGLTFIIDAPADATEAEVNDFAAANADSWVNGGRYRMEADTGEPAKPEKSARNLEAEAAVKSLDEQMAALTKQIGELRQPTSTPGGAAVAIAPSRAQQDQIRAHQAKLAELQGQREKLVIGTTGQTVGGIGGSLGGAGIGVLAGSPFGLPGMAIGGALGSIFGGAAGTAAGTHLWDIPQAREALDISDAEAAELIKSRAIESLIWDGAFVLVLGPGGRVIGKMANGVRFGPALQASVKESVAWDQIKDAGKKQLQGVAEKRAAVTEPHFSQVATETLGVEKKMTDEQAAANLVGDISKRSGGNIPTQGGMVGLAEGMEAFARRQSPTPFLKNDKVLIQTVEKIRRDALKDLENAGAYGRSGLGNALNDVVTSATTTVKRVTGPIFDRAAEQNIAVDMTPAVKYMEKVLAEDLESGKRLLTTAERNSLESSVEAIRGPLEAARADAKKRGAILVQQPVTMSTGAAQNFISGNKAAARAVAPDGTAPSVYLTKVLAEMNKIADESYLAALRTVEDPALARDLLGARKLYRDTLQDLYSDAMAKAAKQDAEDVGRALTPKGAVTEIRELRKALTRAVTGAPAKSRYVGGVTPRAMTELGKEAMDKERSRIDAGLIKGFIERNTMSLTDLEDKLRDPEFRDTLKELLMGEGVANPVLGKKVLAELDRVVAVVKMVRPEMAPQPGKIAPGVGSVGGGTIGAAATGTDIRGAVPLVFATLGISRLFGNMAAQAMTSGNTGIFRTVERAVALAPAAGKNAAAAEVLKNVMREIDEWDRQNGGAGLSAPQPEPKTFDPRTVGHLGSRG